MLAALLLNLPTGSATHGGGPDRSDGGRIGEERRRYYELLLARRLRFEAQRRDSKAKAAKAQQAATERAFATVLAVKPAIARQIVQPYTARLPDSDRFAIDWDRLIADRVAMECLCRQQMELEDEEALLYLLAGEL